MSKGKEFPPRIRQLSVRQVLAQREAESGAEMHAACTVRPAGTEYISLEEHSHLLAEARRAAYAKAAEDFRQAGETALYNHYYLLATEGASDEH